MGCSSCSALRIQWRTTRCRPSDRKSTRLNSSHSQISYAVFCLKKKDIVNATTAPCPVYLIYPPVSLYLSVSGVPSDSLVFVSIELSRNRSSKRRTLDWLECAH